MVGSSRMGDVTMLSRLSSRFKTMGQGLLVDAAVAFSLRVLGAFLALGFSLAIARSLEATGVGLYFSALAVIMMATPIARMGLDNALLRFVAVGASQDDWGKVSRVVRSGLGRSGLFSLVICVAICVFAGPIAMVFFSEPALVTPLRVMSFGVFAFSMATLVSQMLKGVRHIRNALLVISVLPPFFATLMVWPLGQIFGTPGACAAYVLGMGLSTLIGWYFWGRARKPVTTNTEKGAPEALWQAARPLWAMTVLTMGVLPWVPMLLLGMWGDMKDTGIFGITGRLAALTSFTLMAINNILAPRFAVLHSEGKIESLKTIARQFSLINVIVAIPAIGILVFAGERLLGLFGAEFVEGYPVLIILLLGQMVNCMTGSVGILLMMTGNERSTRNAAICAVIVMTILCITLIPTYGAVGAAIAAASASMTSNLFAMVVVYRRLGFFVIPWIR